MGNLERTRLIKNKDSYGQKAGFPDFEKSGHPSLSFLNSSSVSAPLLGRLVFPDKHCRFSRPRYASFFLVSISSLGVSALIVLCLMLSLLLSEAVSN